MEETSRRGAENSGAGAASTEQGESGSALQELMRAMELQGKVEVGEVVVSDSGYLDSVVQFVQSVLRLEAAREERPRQA